MPYPSNHSAMALFVQRLASHTPLDADAREALLSLPVQRHDVRAHADFVEVGSSSDHASLVAEGLVGRFGQTGDGRRQIVSLHLPGEIADLQSVIVPQATTALTALTGSTLLRVAHNDLRRVGLRHPGIATAFWRACVVEAAIVAQWLINIGQRPARSRMAHLFCEMATRYALLDQSDGRRYRLPMTQEQLGDALGLTSVHVNRTLQGLREERLVSVSRDSVEILDWDGLVAAGEFDRAYLAAA
ncbi:MAG TPA: Crp/Fnr family transcriptional regulator [Sphingomonas bacterium]|jgi:CRP-like cAMP-binding protein|uniref:Crp/Fnr family transcriptional regulator n=1 Tax=Sphingomonas bacterium TaxID=1895847 RepID=A0A3D0WE60_9SPHN|nr:Crp/Fnr family transcriptional regulator [Sphingomonas bacterium]